MVFPSKWYIISIYSLDAVHTSVWVCVRLSTNNIWGHNLISIHEAVVKWSRLSDQQEVTEFAEEKNGGSFVCEIKMGGSFVCEIKMGGPLSVR